MRGRGPTLTWAILAVALIVSMASPALAQSGSGTISGLVKDASGSVVPGVSVTATNRGTNAVTTATTNTNGLYSLLNLPIGTYAVNFTLQGFTPYTREGIQVGLGEAITLDHTLAVGGVAEAVTVSADTALLNKSNPEVGTSMASDIVTNLPLNFAGGPVARELRLRRRAECRGQQLDLEHQRGRALHQGGRSRRHLGGHPDRRAHRRVQPPHGGGRGVHGPDERDPRGVRAHGGRPLQLLAQVGHEPVPGKRLRLPPQRGPERQHLAEQLPGGDGSRERRRTTSAPGPPVPRRGEPGGADHQGQDLLLRGRRGVPAVALPARGLHPDRADRSGCWAATSAQLLNTGAAPLGHDSAGNPIYPGAIFDPGTGRVFPGNVIPGNRISSTSQQIVDIYRQGYLPAGRPGRQQLGHPLLQQPRLQAAPDQRQADPPFLGQEPALRLVHLDPAPAHAGRRGWDLGPQRPRQDGRPPLQGPPAGRGQPPAAPQPQLHPLLERDQRGQLHLLQLQQPERSRARPTGTGPRSWASGHRRRQLPHRSASATR